MRKATMEVGHFRRPGIGKDCQDVGFALGQSQFDPIYRDKGQFDASPGEQDEQSSNASLKKWFQVWIDPRLSLAITEEQPTTSNEKNPAAAGHR